MLTQHIKIWGQDKYEMRTPDNDRFKDRRMQNLLRAIEENVHGFSPGQKVTALWSVVKLRLPADGLLMVTIEAILSDFEYLTPKEMSTFFWCLAKIKYRQPEITKVVIEQTHRLCQFII